MLDETPKPETVTAGGAFFGKLKALGVDYVFANSGTDFPPIIEGLIEAGHKKIDLPTPITCPHENVAMGMAHGYYQISGKPQSVMLHTNVGLANGTNGAINAWCDQIPMILMSGRTPVMEKTRFGARTVPIGWGQEMFDQTALVRECTKWDYELRFPEQVSELFDRAWAISNSTPKGPVYLSLPRETLCEQTPAEGLDAPSAMQPMITAPDPAALKRAADLLAGAKNPADHRAAGRWHEGGLRCAVAVRRGLGAAAVPLLGQPDRDPDVQSDACRLDAKRASGRSRRGAGDQRAGAVVARQGGTAPRRKSDPAWSRPPVLPDAGAELPRGYQSLRRDRAGSSRPDRGNERPFARRR